LPVTRDLAFIVPRTLRPAISSGGTERRQGAHSS
jgi:hypothetical protein